MRLKRLQWSLTVTFFSPIRKCNVGGRLFPYTSVNGLLALTVCFLVSSCVSVSAGARTGTCDAFPAAVQPSDVLSSPSRGPHRVAGNWPWWRQPRRFCTMTPMTPSKKALSSKVTFASLTQNNLGTVRTLNRTIFPIKYSEKFYSEILLPEVEEFCKLSVCQYVFFLQLVSVPIALPVYYKDIPVGTICCRFEQEGDAHHLYLLTMGVLAVRAGLSSARGFSANMFTHLSSPIDHSV